MSLLSDWRGTMRRELRLVVEALDARQAGLIPDVAPALVIPLEDARRDRYLGRGAMLARELGTEVDPPPATDTEAPEARPRRRRTEW